MPSCPSAEPWRVPEGPRAAWRGMQAHSAALIRMLPCPCALDTVRRCLIRHRAPSLSPLQPAVPVALSRTRGGRAARSLDSGVTAVTSHDCSLLSITQRPRLDDAAEPVPCARGDWRGAVTVLADGVRVTAFDVNRVPFSSRNTALAHSASPCCATAAVNPALVVRAVDTVKTRARVKSIPHR